MGTYLAGSDGHPPQYEPDSCWKIFGLHEVWMGPTTPGLNHFVPKLLDYVLDVETYETWRVDALDPVTLIPTLTPIKPKGLTFAIDETDVLYGVDASNDGQTWLAYLNTSVTPHTLTVDQRLHIDGTLSSYAKIFFGTDTNATTGEVISKMYDASGNFLSSKIPLELCALDGKTNYAVKAVKRCYVTTAFKDAEILTVVVYADDGHVVTKRQLKVLNTNTIADVNDGLKYITSIDLECIWMSNLVTDQINYPLNIPMDALNLTGVVTYSDGTTVREAVGTNKFMMLGLDGRLSSITGQPHELVLSYRLSDTETSIGPMVTNGRIVKPYTILTTNPNDSISVKLFGYPFWVSDVSGYEMRWFLLNMSRNVFFEVTSYVKFAENSGAFEPLKYGYVQRKTVTLNLRDVSGSFIPFVHTQVVDIILNQAANSDPVDCWLVGTEASDTYPRFGVGVYGKKVDKLVNFGGDFETQDAWLEAYYWRTRPLVDTTTELKAPKPTHFIVTYNGLVTEWSIDDWNKNLQIAEVVTSKSTAFIRFIKRTAAGDLQLSYAAAMIKTIV